MENYIGNPNQFDNNMTSNQQSSNIFNMSNKSQPSMMFNQPSNNLSSNNFQDNYSPKSLNPILTIDTALLDGTNLDDVPNPNSRLAQPNSLAQDTTLIKSVAREIINGLRENNMSLYDNSSLNSYKNKISDINDDNYSKTSNKSKKSKNKVKEVVEKIEDFVIDNKTNLKSYSDYTGWFFDECFNYKDFLIIFILYFVLSQEMIKDFFAKYFSSLNPDYEGKIGIQGVIIYGLILTVLFMVIRNFF